VKPQNAALHKRVDEPDTGSAKIFHIAGHHRQAMNQRNCGDLFVDGVLGAGDISLPQTCSHEIENPVGIVLHDPVQPLFQFAGLR
jgi:hypothetical protein